MTIDAYPDGPYNYAPTVDITAPATNSTYNEGDTVTFTATASDTEDGNLNTSIQWSSSKDGTLGSGDSVTTSSLTVGVHTITATVTDSGGKTGSETIKVSVFGPGAGPVTYNNNIVTPIPDNNLSGINSTITVLENFTIQNNVTITVNITHTWKGDLG